MTLSVWVYPTKDKDYVIFSDRKSNLAIGLEVDAFVVGISNGGISYYKKNIPNTYNDNNWHHIVLIKTIDNNLDLYIDNTLTTTNTNKSSWAQNSDYFRIMHRMYNESYFFNGKMSDLRIYATALSEDDIKELYESKISVDKNGNVFIKDIIEE